VLFGKSFGKNENHFLFVGQIRPAGPIREANQPSPVLLSSTAAKSAPHVRGFFPSISPAACALLRRRNPTAATRSSPVAAVAVPHHMHTSPRAALSPRTAKLSSHPTAPACTLPLPSPLSRHNAQGRALDDKPCITQPLAPAAVPCTCLRAIRSHARWAPACLPRGPCVSPRGHLSTAVPLQLSVDNHIQPKRAASRQVTARCRYCAKHPPRPQCTHACMPWQLRHVVSR
jgi:hypothetical protein